MNPAVGGPVEALKQLISLLHNNSHSVEIASLDSPDAPWLAEAPAPVHALGPGIGAYGFSPSFVPWLKENAERFDCVIIRGIWRFNSFGTWLALRRSPVPYFVFTHGMLDPWFKKRYPLKHLKKALYWPWADYRVLRDAAAVLFTSEEERRLARGSFWLYRCTEEVVNYGTSGPDLPRDRAVAAFNAAFPKLRDNSFVVFMGRIHPKKGCDLLLLAFAQIAQLDPRLQVVFAGPDETGMRSQLEAQSRALGIADRVHWTGMLEGAEKWGALFAAQALCLPSHQENFGVVIAEALACGTPVLISDKVNIWREVECGGAGFVAPDTLEGALDLLTRWLALEQSQRAEMASKAEICFAEHFSIDQAAASLLAAVARHPKKTM